VKFLKNRVSTPRADFPRAEYIPMNLAELQAFERVLLHAAACQRRARPDITSAGCQTELIGSLYQRMGAASVTQPDPDRARIPLHRGEFMWLEFAVDKIERYRGGPEIAREGRQLLNRFNALLGQQRAVIHMGGTPVFDPDGPAPMTDDVPHTTAPYGAQQITEGTI
jgi:hypothetical protein